jgi:hypothetical protein
MLPSHGCSKKLFSPSGPLPRRKDFPRSAVTPPLHSPKGDSASRGATRNSTPLWLPPSRFALLGWPPRCPQTHGLRTPSGETALSQETSSRAPRVVSQRCPTSHGDPEFAPLLGASRNSKINFFGCLTSPFLIPVVAPSTSLIWKKKINNYAQVETPLC